MGSTTVRVASDGQERLQDLVARYRPAVRDFFARRVHSISEAEDLAQEVILRILKRAEVGPIDNVEGYIFHAAANLWRERNRQAAIHAAPPGVELEPALLGGEDHHTPERIVTARDACQQMLTALYELPERTRTVFVLNRFEGLKGPEIASRLGISLSAVEKHMMRALAHVRARQS